MLVRRDQVLASLRVGVDLVGADRAVIACVRDRSVDLEQASEAKASLDRVLFPVRDLDRSHGLVLAQSCPEAAVDLEATADPAPGAIRPGQDAVRAPDLHGHDLRPA